MLSFRLLTIFYVFALLAAALGTFGPIGIVVAAAVLLLWAWIFYGPRGFTWIEYVAVFGIMGLLIILLLPAVQSARGAAQRSMCMSNLKQIQLAILNHESAKGTMPPAYVADANGKPMHSWRVLILPFLGETALYAKYNFNEPWNGPNNSKLASQIPDVYRCPSHSTASNTTGTDCHYFAMVDPASGWPGAAGRPIRQFRDGTSKTIMVIEASGLGINWMEPRDLTMNEAVKLLTTRPRSGHAHVRDGFLTTTYTETSARNVAYCDGSVHWMDQITDPALAKALITAVGSETIPANWPSKIVPSKTTVVVKWGVVWGLSVFLILALLPAAWSRRKRSERTMPPGEDEVILVPIAADGGAAVPTVT
jgi:type II secretory pathway pseudopilin PulG